MSFELKVIAHDGAPLFHGRHGEHTAYFNELNVLPEMLKWDVRIRYDRSELTHVKIEAHPEQDIPCFFGINPTLSQLATPESPKIRANDIITTLKAGDLWYGTNIQLTPSDLVPPSSFNAVKELKIAFARKQAPQADPKELLHLIRSWGDLPVLEFKN